MEGCGNCLKYLMIVFNFLFFVCGGVLLGVGIWVIVDGASFMNVVATNPVIFNASYLLIAAGGALLVISFFGFCGALKESKCLLGLFAFFVFVIFVVEIVGAILAFVYYPQVREVALASITRYNPNSTDVIDRLITNGWDTIQSVVPCCGFNSSENWVVLSELYSVPEPRVPESCCERDRFSLEGMVINKTNCIRLAGNYYQDPCEARIQSYFWISGGIGLGILVVELLAMIFACCLYRAIGKDY